MTETEKRTLNGTIAAFAIAVLVTRDKENKRELIEAYKQFYNDFLNRCNNFMVSIALKTCYEVDMQEEKIINDNYNYHYWYHAIGVTLKIVLERIKEL